MNIILCKTRMRCFSLLFVFCLLISPEITASIDQWSESKVYNLSDIVSLNNKTYEATHWSQGINPEKDAWGVWKSISAPTPNPEPVPENYDSWNESKIYYSGDIVVYNNRVYKNVSPWSQGINPEQDAWGAWEKLQTVDPTENIVPTVKFNTPLDNALILQDTLSSIAIDISTSDADGEIVENIISVENNNYTGTSANWTPSAFGSYTISASAKDDAGAISSKNITVTIKKNETGENLAPIALDDAVTTTSGTAVTINALKNDSDPENDNLTIHSISPPDNGSAAIENNSIKYTPEDGFTGTDNFSYTVKDSHGNESTASITVTVKEQDNALDSDTVKFEVSSKWLTGFNGKITITNTTDEPWSEWEIEFDMPYALSIWSAIVTENSGYHYRIKNQSWNGVLNPGESVTFGFSASPGGDIIIPPANIIVNGKNIINENTGLNISFEYPKDGDIIEQGELEPVSIRINASSNDSNQLNTSISVEGKTFNSQEVSWIPSSFGSHKILGYVEDDMGKVQTKEIQVTIVENRNLLNIPEVNILSPTNLEKIRLDELSPIQINLHAQDLNGDIKSISVEVDGQKFSGINAIWKPSYFGTHTIISTIEDFEGNTATDICYVSIIQKQVNEGVGVKGWPDFVSMGAVTGLEIDKHYGREVDSIFKYAGAGGNGDPGEIQFPIWTVQTAELAEKLTAEYGRRVIPVMVVYTGQMSGGINFDDLHDFAILERHFVNLILVAKTLESYRSDTNPYPGAIVMNPDFLGMINQQNLLDKIAAKPVEVQKALNRAIHAIEDKVTYAGIPMDAMGVYSHISYNKDKWTAKVEFEEYAEEKLQNSPATDIPGLPAFENNLKGWIQANNYIITRFAPHVTFGWQENIWSSGDSYWAGHSLTDEEIKNNIASKTVELWKELNVYEGPYKPDFIVFDKAEIDDMNTDYLFNDSGWNSFMSYVKHISQGLGNLPVMLWQLPGGHIQIVGDVDQRNSNGSSATNYFFGDPLLKPDLSNIKSYIAPSNKAFLLENGYNWSTSYKIKDVNSQGNVFSILWGGGNTTSVGRVPYDDGGWLSNTIKKYYQNPVYIRYDNETTNSGNL